MIIANEITGGIRQSLNSRFGKEKRIIGKITSDLNNKNQSARRWKQFLIVIHVFEFKVKHYECT